MVVQVDYVIAVAIFIITFATSITFVTNYFTTLEDTTRIANLRSVAFSFSRISDRGFFPENWTSNQSDTPSRIGLQTYAYRFFVLVNNTQSNLINQSQSVVDLIDETISFNYTNLGFQNIDYNSTIIYNESGSEVSYSRSSDTITFKINISANTTKWFTVYFDDDSNFTDRSTTISGTNNLTEKIYPVEKISLLQYKKIKILENSNYSSMKNNVTNEDFHIDIYDLNYLNLNISNQNGIWHFDENSGNIAYDSSGYGNNGTIYGATWNSSGKFGSALRFDGVNDYVDIASGLNNQFGEDVSTITIEAWVKFSDNNPGTDAEQNRKTIFNKPLSGRGVENTIWLGWGNVAITGFHFITGSKTEQNRLTYNWTPSIGTWYHVAATFNGITKKLYVNGELVNSSSWSSTIFWNTSLPAQIGVDLDLTYNDFFNGTIDEVKIWGRALSSEEISASYNAHLLDYGGSPGEENVIALQRYILYQTSTASVRSGKLLIKVW